VSSCVYYIAGECLRNVSKHAQAQSASIDIELLGDSLRMCVKDDGAGFDRHSFKPSGGIGVAAMRERARLQGGTLAIQSSSEFGTRIDVEVPINVS
jgi:NarL family two-component system sensor histidine kinase YdfH